MKYLLMLDDPIWIAIIASLTVYVFRLRQRMAGLNDPRLYLSKNERRAWARRELEQRQFDHDSSIIDQFTNEKERP